MRELNANCEVCKLPFALRDLVNCVLCDPALCRDCRASNPTLCRHCLAKQSVAEFQFQFQTASGEQRGQIFDAAVKALGNAKAQRRHEQLQRFHDCKSQDRKSFSGSEFQPESRNWSQLSSGDFAHKLDESAKFLRERVASLQVLHDPSMNIRIQLFSDCLGAVEEAARREREKLQKPKGTESNEPRTNTNAGASPRNSQRGSTGNLEFA